MKTLASAAVVVLALSIGSATATTINFDDLTQHNAAINFVPSTIVESGYQISGSLFAVFGTAEPRFAGATGLHEDGFHATDTVTKVGGGSFNVQSIDLANLNFPGSDEAIFTGHVHGGGTVTQTVNFDSFGHLTTFDLAGFDNLDSLTFEQISIFYQFDNLVVTAIPEPMMLPVFGTALAGLVLLRRRRSIL